MPSFVALGCLEVDGWGGVMGISNQQPNHTNLIWFRMMFRDLGPYKGTFEEKVP